MKVWKYVCTDDSDQRALGTPRVSSARAAKRALVAVVMAMNIARVFLRWIRN